MANLTSTLLLSLRNNFSGPAKTIERDAKGLDRSLRGIGKGAAARALAGGSTAMLGGLAGTLGAVGGGMAARKAVVDAADWDRRITRILITADAAAGRADEVRKTVRDVAAGTGAQIPDIVEGLDSLVSSGRTLEDSLAMLPSVTATAQAAGAATADIARTADALGTSLGILPDRMQSAFDILVAGGKAGKFELKDMASELPSLAAAASAAGLKGESGLRKLVAMLQTIRTQTGSSSEAATAMSNVFQKMETEETANKFKKFGIDLRKEMAKARKEGKDLIDVFLDLAVKAVKGDLSKLPQLFADAQFLQGTRALIQRRDATDQMADSLKRVDGSTIRDLGKVSDDAKAKLDALANAWSQLFVTLGKSADASGVTRSLGTLSELLDKLASGDYKGASQVAASYLAYGDDSPEKRADRKKDKPRSDILAAERARQEAIADMEKYQPPQEIVDRYEMLHRESQQRELTPAERIVADRDYATLSLARKGQWNAWDRANAAASRGRDAMLSLLPDLPPELRGVPSELQPTPVPRRKPTKAERATAGTVDAPSIMVPAFLDDKTVDEAAYRAAKRAQAIFDANRPVLRPYVDTSGVVHSVGQEVQSQLDGSYSDNSGRR